MLEEKNEELEQELGEELLPFCAHGCGQRVTKKGNKYLRGHSGHINLVPLETRFCECHCGSTFECKVTSKQRFIHGHNTRVMPEICIGNKTRGVSKTEEEKEQRRVTLKRKHASGEIIPAMLGKEGATKGMTWEEIHGEEKAAQMKIDLVTWIHTPEANKKISESKKGIPLSEQGHGPDCTCWICKAVRGETCGENNSFFGHKHTRDAITKGFLATQRRPTSFSNLHYSTTL